MQKTRREPALGLVAVGFSSAGMLALLAEHLGWDSTFLCDESRDIYRACGFGLAPLRRVYSPGTLTAYAKAVLRGDRVRLPTEDTRQLGGDGVIRDGVLVRRWRPRSPDDRVSPLTLLHEAESVLTLR